MRLGLIITLIGILVADATLAQQFGQDSTACTLNFYRPKNFMGSATSVSISINGTKIDKIKNGERIEFSMHSEGVIKIEGVSSSPRANHSLKIQATKGESRYIKINWVSGYAFRIEDMDETDGASEFFNEELFKGKGEIQFFAESQEYPIKIFESSLPATKGKSITGTEKIQATGSGFFISSQGYLVTNYHVIEDNNGIYVRNVEGDKSTKYKAVPIVEDRFNDLVILKITDEKFSGLDSIPYQFDPHLADVGEDVFALGYPLTQSMGDEVKLTDGIISSQTGFEGNIITYQVSVPLQPGNSGGPLFTKDGNLIGIAAAIHTEAENVSYAIKSNFLVNLMNLEPDSYGFSKRNILYEKSLPEQIKMIEDYVVLIEVY